MHIFLSYHPWCQKYLNAGIIASGIFFANIIDCQQLDFLVNIILCYVSYSFEIAKFSTVEIPQFLKSLK